MSPLLFASDVVFIELDACHNLTLFGWTVVLWKSCCMCLLALRELIDFELILVSLIGWESHLSLIHVVEHGRLLHILVLSVAKAGLVNRFVVYPWVARVLSVGSLIKLSCLFLRLIFHLLIGIFGLCLLKGTAFDRHLRLPIFSLGTFHLGRLLKDKLLRWKLARMFHIDILSCSFIDGLEWIPGSRSVINLSCLRPSHQIVLESRPICFWQLVLGPGAQSLGWCLLYGLEVLEQVDSFLVLALRRKTITQSFSDALRWNAVVLDGSVSSRICMVPCFLRRQKHVMIMVACGEDTRSGSTLIV